MVIATLELQVAEQFWTLHDMKNSSINTNTTVNIIATDSTIDITNNITTDWDHQQHQARHHHLHQHQHPHPHHQDHKDESNPDHLHDKDPKDS